MSRSSTTKTKKRTAGPRRLLLPALAAALAVGFPAVPAHAGGYVYQQHVVNAGVLITSTDPAPYLFYVLNNRPDVKSPDLTLINPLAPANADPKTAAYWEVSLNSISDSELAQYNVLYLRADGITFGPIINERLRRFVDNGGQLIVEYAGAAKPVGLFTGAGATSGTGTPVTLPAAGPSAAAILSHPITTQPYLLSQSDLTSLGNPGLGNPSFFLSTAADPIHGAEFNNLFGSALLETAGPVVSAAQIGAGQVVVSTLNIGAGISVHNAAAFATADLYTASTADLKLLANIIAWSETHPTENKTSHGNASNAGLASFSPAWQYAPASPTATPPSGAAVWGNFVFAVDSAGILHALDAYPAENLTGTAATTGPVAGAEQVTTGLSKYPATSYDEIWNASVGANASAPTVASVKGVNYVFVETRTGAVAAFNAVTGALVTGLNAPFALSMPTDSATVSYPQAPTSNAPAPTLYDGRLYAGQADGKLDVYDLNDGTSVAVPLDQNTLTGGEPVTGQPAVGTLATGDTNVLAAVVSTPYNIYTVLLGARNEVLRTYEVNGATTGYSINRLGHYDMNNIFADINAVAPPLLAYDYNGNYVAGAPISSAPNPQDPLFPITGTAGYYTDWNMDFEAAIGQNSPAVGAQASPVNLNYISASSYGSLGSPTAASAFSAAAIDRRGDYYYTETISPVNSNTVNSYLVGVANAPLHSNVHIKFRFRMPTTADGATTPAWTYIDADGVNYNNTNFTNANGIVQNVSLLNYHFVGAPVIDDQGNVYVAAVSGANSSLATVLCFRGDQQVSAVIPANGAAVDLTQVTVTQPDEGGGDMNTIQRGPDTNVGAANATYGQFIASANNIQFYNFGKRGRTFAEIAGTVTEPQPVTANSTDGTGTATTLEMQTNLAWYVAPFALTQAYPNAAPPVAAGTISGLSLVGSSLFLCDGTALYRLSTNPQVSTGKLVSTPPSVTPIGTGIASAVANGAPTTTSPVGVGVVGAPPSIGGSVMVINGTLGIAARTRQVTVIADNNRVVGVDGDGSAVWAVDATTRTDLTATPNVATKVPLSHPTALSQFALNDYLVADTGDNRCVRFDSAGNVQWELTRFQDPYGLMASGQPLTLSGPSSVVTRIVTDTDINNTGGNYTYYLVADSGNNRVIEVCDRLNSAGGIFVDPIASHNEPVYNHALTWVSHTGDTNGRRYRYGNAVYYTSTQTVNGVLTPVLNIAAIVTNTRLAPLVGGQLGSASADAPGGSLVVFGYPTLPLTAQAYSPNAANELIYTTAGFYAATSFGASPTYTPFTIRNPRFLQLSTPLTTASAPANGANGVPAFDFLYADDNGVFDLTYDTTKGAFVAGLDRLKFTTTDYHNMLAPVDASVTLAAGVAPATTYARVALPFIPTCVQELSSDSTAVGSGNSGTSTRRYLITQNYSQGELGNTSATGKLGGEIFEVDVATPVTNPSQTVAGVTPPPVVTGSPVITEPGGFGGSSTLSHPGLTGPLTQPTYAVRLP